MRKHRSNKVKRWEIVWFVSLFIALILVFGIGIYRDKQLETQSKMAVALDKQKQLDELNQKRQANKWYDTKALFLGDSITNGLNPLNYNEILNSKYTDILKQKLEFSEVKNYGINGSRITSTNDGDGMIERYNKMTDESDLIGVFGGTNDFGFNVELGNIDDGDNTHFKNAFNNLIKGLIEKYPNKKIFVITPIPRNLKYPNKNEIGLTLKDYVDVEIQICNMYKIPILNLYQDYGIDPHNENDMNKYMPDGLHPNLEGQQILADKIIEFINTI